MNPADASIVMYNLALLPVLVFSVIFFILTLLNLFVDTPAKQKTTARRPFVTIQIPSYNDAVAATCVEACVRQAYPKDRYEIQLLDDSTDTRTQEVLRAVAKKHAGMVQYIHRKNRAGYKPGALADAMHRVRGDIIVIFDADFVPRPDFLKRIVAPFDDKQVAIVQGRQAFSNKDVNLVSRFAAYLLMTYHAIVMPIHHKANSVMFCGTAGAIRKSAMISAGGWNTHSITEDSDLSVRIMAKGYKTVYVPFETPSEVPVTLEGFLKQQMRWSYGNVRVWFDHWKLILGKSKLTLSQRLMVTFVTLGNLVAPAVILMTLAGMLGWFFGDVQLITTTELWEFFIAFFYTAGFLAMGIVTLIKHKSLKEFPQLLLATLSISLILAIANTIAVYKAILRPNQPLFPKEKNRKMWICTAKQGNAAFRG